MLEINDAEIYCNVFWDDHPDRTSIVLIRDSTIDSYTECDSRKPGARAIEITEGF